MGSEIVETKAVSESGSLDSVGESILQWADPEIKFRGYTEVCVNANDQLRNEEKLTLFPDESN